MRILLLLFVLGLTVPCHALEDTPENREKEADRYLAATPPAEMLSDVATNMAQNMPETQRGQFIDMMTKNMDTPALSAAMKQAMVKVFTADELKALADFYSSPNGKSAMKKMGAYMADLMPVIQTEVQKALAKTQAQAAEQSDASDEATP